MKKTEILQLFAGAENAGEAPSESAAAENGNAETENIAEENSGGAPEKKDDEAAQKPPAEKKSELGMLMAVRASLEESEKAKQIDEVIRSWEKDAAELKEVYPGFELAEAVKNKEIGQLLCAGVPLRRAYETVNLEKIIGSAMRFASLNAGKKAAGALLQHRSRPQENGVLDRASSVKRADVRSLTEKDILHILGEVSKGVKISF